MTRLRLDLCIPTVSIATSNAGPVRCCQRNIGVKIVSQLYISRCVCLSESVIAFVHRSTVNKWPDECSIAKPGRKKEDFRDNIRTKLST